VDGAIQSVETLVLPDGSCVYTPAGATCVSETLLHWQQQIRYV